MKEKFNLDIVFDKGSEKIDINDELPVDIENNVVRGKIEDVEILEKNEKEIESIEKVNKIVGEVLDELNLERLQLDKKYIHIISSEGLRSITNSSTITGAFREGHIYIPRTKNMSEFVSILTHEMMHDSSYLKSKIIIKENNNDIDLTVDVRRRGLGLQTESNGTLGVGISEGMCELLADPVRKRYIEQENIEGDERNKLEELSYYAQMLILNEAFKALDGEEGHEGYSSFVKAYMLGDRSALKDISKKFIDKGMNNGLKILFEMGNSNESALETAKKLGFKDVQKEIEEIINKEKIEKIRNLEGLEIGAAQKAEIILIILGHKPATELTVYEHNSSKDDVEDILRTCNLCFVEKPKTVENDGVVANFAIARDEETINRLMEVNADNEHEEYGRLMGYPESAINAFMNKELLLADGDYPDMTGIVFPLKLSKNNWKEEYEILKKRSEEIKEYSRETYNELMPIEKSEKLEEFEKIKTPGELLSFMSENIVYGIVGKRDSKIYSPTLPGWKVGEQPEVMIQSPKELLESGYGMCWEQTELEKQWFKKKNYEFKTILFRVGEELSEKNPGHTILAYKDKDKWRWFENSFGDLNGAKKFESLKDLKKEVKNKVIKLAVDNGATQEEIEGLKLLEYKTVPHDCSSPGEFFTKVFEENK